MIFEYENNKVSLLPEALTLPVVAALRESDKTKGKAFYHMWIKYIYFAYRNEGIYNNQFLTTRKRMTCVNQLKKDDNYWKTIEGNDLVMALINWYQKYSKEKEEQLLDALDKDIDTYLEYLKDIPYTKSIKVEETVDEELKSYFKEEDNSTEKMKAIKNSRDLILYRKELKKLVKENGHKKSGKQTRTRKYEE